jgi:hypothetical protein
VRSLGSFANGQPGIPRNEIVSLDPHLDRSNPDSVHSLLLHVKTESMRYLMNDGTAVAFNVWM